MAFIDPDETFVDPDEHEGLLADLAHRAMGGQLGAFATAINMPTQLGAQIAGTMYGAGKGVLSGSDEIVKGAIEQGSKAAEAVRLAPEDKYTKATQDILENGILQPIFQGARNFASNLTQPAIGQRGSVAPLAPPVDPLSAQGLQTANQQQLAGEAGFDIGTVTGAGEFGRNVKLKKPGLAQDALDKARKIDRGNAVEPPPFVDPDQQVAALQGEVAARQAAGQLDPAAQARVQAEGDLASQRELQPPGQQPAPNPFPPLDLSSEGLLPNEPPPPPSGGGGFPVLPEGPETPVPPLKGTTPFKQAGEPTHVEPPTVDSNYESLTGVKSETPLPQLSDTDRALSDPGIEAQRVADMKDNTNINDLRNQFPSIDFPLRQEVLEHPEIKASIDAFRQEAADLQSAITKGDKEAPALLEQLKNEFGAGMKQLGIDKPEDAFGRPLFESGTETKLPIEKTERPALPSEPDRPWTAITDPDKLTVGGKFAKQGEKGARPIEKTSTFRGGKQRGSVSLFGAAGKTIPLADRLRIAKGQLDKALSDHTDNLGLQAMAKTARDEQLRNMNESHARGDDAGYQGAAIHAGRHSEMLEVLKEEEKVNFENLAYARDLHDRLARQAAQPPAKVTPMFPKQRGAIGDPKFLKFKADLKAQHPELAGQASALWKQLQKEKNQMPELTPGQRTSTAIANIPGFSHLTQEVAPMHEMPYAEVKPLIAAQPPRSINMFARNLYSGGNMMAFSKKSIIVRFTADLVNNALQRAVAKTADIILNKQTGVKARWESLTDKEKVDLAQALVEKEGKGAVYQLNGDQMIAAHDATRGMLDKAFDSMNEGRVALGLKPLEKRAGYLAARWMGDFKIPVIKDGNLVTYITARTKYGAERAAKTFDPGEGYTTGPVEYRPLNPVNKGRPDQAYYLPRKENDVITGYRELTKMFEESDPGVGAIHDAYEKYLAEQGKNFQGIPKHFENKSGIGGYQGNKPWLDPLQNAKDLIHSQMKYAESMFKWSEMQKANAKLKQLFADTDNWNTHPDEMKYAKFYSDMAFGRHTVIERAINDMIDMTAKMTGIGRGVASDYARATKNYMTLNFLGFTNMYFPAAQGFEPLQALPMWMHYLNGRGASGNAAIAMWKAGRDVLSPRAAMSDFGLKAYDWAHNQHLFDSFFVDQVRSATSKPYLEAADTFMKFIPSHAESFSRYSTFMSFAHMLNDSGVPFHEAMGSAAKLSNLAVQNFRRHERALVYRHLGIVGEMASTFTGYMHHQYTQLASFANRGEWKTVGIGLTTQLILGGALGMYAVNDIDTLIKGWNFLTSHTGMNQDYVPSVKATILKHMPDWMSFGVASEIIHSDLSNRLDAASIIPGSPGTMIVPFWGAIAKAIYNWGKFGADRTQESLLGSVHATLPTGGKAIVEEMDRAPNGMFKNPETGEGQYARNTWDRMARMMGGYSMNESRDRTQSMNENDQSYWIKTMKETLSNQFVHSDDPARRQDIAQRYLKLGGTPQALQQALIQHKMNENMSESQRAAGIPGLLHGRPDLNTILQLQRAKQYGEPNK